ncbi:Hypothetical predicted protein, partial [Lecanosticta acicola]
AVTFAYLLFLASGSFSILSLNAARLPAILNFNDVVGDKATDAGYIGEFFTEHGFDFIHVQEDFNYHAHIYATDNYTYRTATSGDVVMGLNTFANSAWADDFARITWYQCDLDSRPVLLLKVTNEDTVTVALYNLHTDVDDEEGDIEARAADIQ